MWDWNTFIIFAFALIWAVLFIRLYQYKQSSSVSIVIGLFPLFLLYALRAESVGMDLINYANNHVNQGGWFLNKDGGIPLEILSEGVYCISYYTGGMRSFLLITSLLEYFFIFIALRELKKRGVGLGIVFAVFFSYVVLRSVSMVRNGIALSCSLCAYAQLFNTDILSRRKYWLFSVMALGFHNSAILNIPIYFICRPLPKSSSHRSRILAFRICGITALALGLFIIGQSGIVNYFHLVTGDIYNQSHFEARESYGFGNLIVRLPFLMLFVLSIPKIRRLGYDTMPFLLFLLLDIVVAQTKYISQDFERLTMYTGLCEVLMWGVLSKVYATRNNVLGKVFLIVIGICYYIYYMYHYAILGGEGEGNGLMPYHFWGS